ncbi:MAG: hypothetical protein QXO51_00145 [Halobacteria archaeon]
MAPYAEEEGFEEEPGEDLEEKGEKDAPAEFVGVCDACGRDVNEGEETHCPHCGAVFHTTCVKKICKKCKTSFRVR